jgi:uncharacterized protein (DUF1499 family)
MSVYVVLGIMLVIFAAVAVQIDDWSRDWTTNFAELSDAAEDPMLRPLTLDPPPAAVAESLESKLRETPCWSVQSRSAEGDVVRLHLTHITRLFGFVDDLHVTLRPTESGGTRVNATSRSRIGKGDLGQNPRNLKQLTRILTTAE